MGMNHNIWVVGGDRRQGHLAELLAQEGYQVTALGLELSPPLADVTMATSLDGIREAHCIILPLPALGEGAYIPTPLSEGRYLVTDLLDRLTSNQILCGGMVNDLLRLLAQGRGLMVHDYYHREELAVANSIPTVEGAIQIAMEELPTTLWNNPVLVIGYGRLGKLLAHRLHGLGAKVDVAARSCADLAWIRAYGYGQQKSTQLEATLGNYPLIFNTVPAPILTESILTTIPLQTLLIDLASKPGGAGVAIGGGVAIPYNGFYFPFQTTSR